MKRWLIGLFCVLLSGAALAAGPAAVRKRVQASMLLTGTIVVAPDGSVSQYSVDHAEKLPPEVSGLLAKAVPAWRFAPVVVDGKPVIAKTTMSMRIVARPVSNDKYSIGVAGVIFNDGQDKTGESITWKNEVQPVYPRDAVDLGVSGTVYVLARVDRQGRVVEAIARQVDLGIIASDEQLAVWRRMLADATMRAVKRSTFDPPTVGKSAADPYWQVAFPVAFALAAGTASSYGQWQLYVPGPVQEAPWVDKRVLAGSADAMPDGGIYQANPVLHLLTPLKGS